MDGTFLSYEIQLVFVEILEVLSDELAMFGLIQEYTRM